MEHLIRRVQDFLSNDHFAIQNHIELESVEPDHAVIRLTIQSDSCNAYGRVHGGALYTMADSAAGIAVMSDNRYYVTQSGSLHFLCNQPCGTIHAIGKVRHRGESFSLVEVNIIGDEYKLLATGKFTFFCINRPLMEQKGIK